eukprot:Skav202477  [mRNA]  locus=scaffold149:669089:674177:+ [translate_table: standard]
MDLASPAAPRHAQKTHAELLQLALSAAQGTPRREVRELLVRQLAVLNGCANRRGKGRKDLHIEAFAVLEAFLELRRYLYRTSQHMVMIDPQLAILAGNARCSLICGRPSVASLLRRPVFRTRDTGGRYDQDAELFLILPRLVLLSGLWDPEHRALARSFAEGWELESDELLTLSLLFPGSQLDFWKLLMSKALEGPGSVADQEFSALLEKPLSCACSAHRVVLTDHGAVQCVMNRPCDPARMELVDVGLCSVNQLGTPVALRDQKRGVTDERIP